MLICVTFMAFSRCFYLEQLLEVLWSLYRRRILILVHRAGNGDTIEIDVGKPVC